MAYGENINAQHKLNHMAPAASEAFLGDVVYDLINGLNDLRNQYLALVAKLETAGTAGLAAGNVASVQPTLPAVLLPEARTHGGQ